MSTQNFAASPSFGPPQNETPSFPGGPAFINVSPAMRKLLQQLDIVGPHVRIALLEGESGVGKHTCARLLYDRYAARHPAIRRCGFTRCDAREWLLSQTDPNSLSGFIFLDRVDLLASPGQALLLRTLKQLDFSHPGALALIASAQSPLHDLSRSGHFLPELAMRLASVRLTIPPLRERHDDVISLANLFLDRLSARYHLAPAALAPGAIARLLQYHWPGNLHELSSTLESALIVCSNGIIRSEDLPLLGPRPEIQPATRPLELLNLDEVIHQHILHVLELNHGNKLRTARQLGISRSTLYRLLEKRLTFSD